MSFHENLSSTIVVTTNHSAMNGTWRYCIVAGFCGELEYGNDWSEILIARDVYYVSPC
jgi:hypothetical protein